MISLSYCRKFPILRSLSSLRSRFPWLDLLFWYIRAGEGSFHLVRWKYPIISFQRQNEETVSNWKEAAHYYLSRLGQNFSVRWNSVRAYPWDDTTITDEQSGWINDQRIFGIVDVPPCNEKMNGKNQGRRKNAFMSYLERKTIISYGDIITFLNDFLHISHLSTHVIYVFMMQRSTGASGFFSHPVLVRNPDFPDTKLSPDRYI